MFRPLHSKIHYSTEMIHPYTEKGKREKGKRKQKEMEGKVIKFQS